VGWAGNHGRAGDLDVAAEVYAGSSGGGVLRKHTINLDLDYFGSQNGLT